MTDHTELARTHYCRPDLTEKIRKALLMVAPETRPLTTAEIAPLDQFHTRGILATRDLVALTSIDRTTRVLDLGSGIGGPARFLAKAFGCHVTGIDLSESFVEAASYLTERCGLQDLVSFQVGNALDLAFAAGSFDLVFLQHVAMNVQDRAALYAEIVRVLSPTGRLATYDVVLKNGDVNYPVPWARESAASFLLTEDETREALIAAGFDLAAWRDDSDLAKAWFATIPPDVRSEGPTLALLLGPDFKVLSGNLRRNLLEDRVGILSAIAVRR